jgi:hypothetical protein
MTNTATALAFERLASRTLAGVVDCPIAVVVEAVAANLLGRRRSAAYARSPRPLFDFSRVGLGADLLTKFAQAFSGIFCGSEITRFCRACCTIASVVNKIVPIVIETVTANLRRGVCTPIYEHASAGINNTNDVRTGVCCSKSREPLTRGCVIAPATSNRDGCY